MEDEAAFQTKLAKVVYKTTYQSLSAHSSNVAVEKGNGISGHFTDHLIDSGMYKNASLNTTADKDRWLNGSKDWMEHLG